MSLSEYEFWGYGTAPGSMTTSPREETSHQGLNEMSTQTRIKPMSPREATKPDESSYGGKLAARIRTLRESRKISVEELAEKISVAGYSVKPITIYSWERGRSSPHIDALPAIAQALGLKSPRSVLPE